MVVRWFTGTLVIIGYFSNALQVRNEREAEFPGFGGAEITGPCLVCSEDWLLTRKMNVSKISHQRNRAHEM